MIKVNSAGIESFNLKLVAEWARFELALSAVFAAWTRRVFTGLVFGSPQWSGDLAANWNYSVNGLDYSYDDSLKDAVDVVFLTGVVQRGDFRAVSIALNRMMNVTAPTWRDTVYFNNETPIAPEVEAHSIHIRPVNLIDGRVAMIQYTIDNAHLYPVV